MSTARPWCHGGRLATGLSVCVPSWVLGVGDIILPTPSLPEKGCNPRHRASFRHLYHQDNSRPQYAHLSLCLPSPDLQARKKSLRSRHARPHWHPLTSPGFRLQPTRTYTVAHMDTRSRHAMDEFDHLLGVQSPSSCLSFMYQDPEPYLDSSNTTASTSPSESPVDNPLCRHVTSLSLSLSTVRLWLTCRRPVRPLIQRILCRPRGPPRRRGGPQAGRGRSVGGQAGGQEETREPVQERAAIGALCKTRRRTAASDCSSY